MILTRFKVGDTVTVNNDTNYSLSIGEVVTILIVLDTGYSVEDSEKGVYYVDFEHVEKTPEQLIKELFPEGGLATVSYMIKAVAKAYAEQFKPQSDIISGELFEGEYNKAVEKFEAILKLPFAPNRETDFSNLKYDNGIFTYETSYWYSGDRSATTEELNQPLEYFEQKFKVRYKEAEARELKDKQIFEKHKENQRRDEYQKLKKEFEGK